MIEWISLAGLVAKGAWDWWSRTHEKDLEAIKKVVRATFGQVVRFLPDDKDQAHALYVSWAEAAILAAGWRMNATKAKIIDTSFEELWAIHSRNAFNSGMAALVKSIPRAEAAAKKLSSMVAFREQQEVSNPTVRK